MPEKTLVLLDNIRTPIPREIAYRVSNVRLKESMRTIGEVLNPIFVCDHGTLPAPAVDLVEGYSRTFLARELGWKEIWAIHVDRPRDDAERELLMWNHNEVRRSLSLKEKRESVFRYMAAEGCDRDVAAARFNLVKAEKSRVFSLDLLSEGDLERLDEAGVIDSIISQIGPVSPREAQLKAIELAITPVSGGKIPSRDVWEQLKDKMMERFVGKKPGRKPGDIKGKPGSGIDALKFRAEAKHDDVIAGLKAIAEIIAANKNLPLKVVIDIINERQDPPKQGK